MAGFFKKLFNRITGKKEEEAQAPLQEQVAVPPLAIEAAPEPVIERQDQAEVEPPPVAAPIAPLPLEKPVAEKAPEKKPELAAPTTKKAKPTKAGPPQQAPKKAAVKKREPQKPDVEEPRQKKAEAEKPQPKKSEEPKAPKAKLLPVKPSKPLKPALEKPSPVKAAPPEPPVAAEPATLEKIPTPKPPAPAPVPIPDAESVPVPQPPLEPPKPAQPAPALEPERKGWFARLRDGLSKSSKSITGSITAIFTKRKLNAETLQELEDTLIQADLGITVSERIVKAVAHGRYDKEIDPQEVKQILATEVASVLKPVEVAFNFGEERPFVVLVVGVNGSGKTTTIGKLGAIAANEGFKVKFAACDTFRAAAIEQLTVWGKRIGAETIFRPPGSDAAGLAFDAMKAAKEDGTDILFVDTAGRLHNKTYLMDELDKVVRVIKKYDANAPHAVILVLDATTGQNALAQAEAFTRVAGVTGLIMTKLDGTARGGILVAIAEKFKLPIHAVGVGESINDLQPFDAEAFARAIAGLDEQ